MRRVAHAVKTIVAYALFYLGALDLLRASRLRGRAVVLMYHRVLGDEARARSASHPGYIVSEATFAMHMACLKARFTVLSERQFLEHLDDGRPFPDSSCLITFDDGWHDNLTEAWPALRAHGLPAVIYLPANFIGTRRLFWREALTHALVETVRRFRQGGALSQQLLGLLREHQLDHLLTHADRDPREVVVAAVQQHTHLRMQDDGALLTAIERELDLDVQSLDTPDRFLSWEEVREMAQKGVAFGAHGMEHRLLGMLPEADANREIQQSMSVVADRAGVPVHSISYPNGSVTSAVRAMVAAAGYRAAFTTQPGLVSVEDDRLMLRRVNVHEDMTSSTPMFLARVLGVF